MTKPRQLFRSTAVKTSFNISLKNAHADCKLQSLSLSQMLVPISPLRPRVLVSFVWHGEEFFHVVHSNIYSASVSVVKPLYQLSKKEKIVSLNQIKYVWNIIQRHGKYAVYTAACFSMPLCDLLITKKMVDVRCRCCNRVPFLHATQIKRLRQQPLVGDFLRRRTVCTKHVKNIEWMLSNWPACHRYEHQRHLLCHGHQHHPFPTSTN